MFYGIRTTLNAIKFSTTERNVNGSETTCKQIEERQATTTIITTEIERKKITKSQMDECAREKKMEEKKFI